MLVGVYLDPRQVSDISKYEKNIGIGSGSCDPPLQTRQSNNQNQCLKWLSVASGNSSEEHPCEFSSGL